MNNSLKGGLALVIGGIMIMILVKLLLPLFEEYVVTSTSDAKNTKGTITIGVDNFIGYFPLCSPEMKRQLRQHGYLLECIDDEANYDTRLNSLSKGQLQFAVATIDAYLLTGKSHNFPGTIITVIDESSGSDALVARRSEIESLDDLKTKQQLKIAYTPDSPSDHLIKSLAVHFDIQRLKERSDWQLHSDGSEAALLALQSQQASAAVLWEPDISKALKDPELIRVIGTEKTEHLITDVLLVERKFASKHPEQVEMVLTAYFHTLQFYRQNPAVLISDIRSHTGLNKDLAATVINGVKWQSLSDNAETWLNTTGKSKQHFSAVDNIASATSILIEYGSLDSSPLPNNDPLTIISSSYVQSLYTSLVKTNRLNDSNTQKNITFAPLSESGWNKLKPFGMLKVRPINFSSGSDQLTEAGRQQLDLAVENLLHYPTFRLSINGHTGVRGDEQQNILLSKQRADAVLRYLEIEHAIPRARMRSVGFGGTQPLTRKPGESSRSYNYRLPRVELVLLGEDF